MSTSKPAAAAARSIHAIHTISTLPATSGSLLPRFDTSILRSSDFASAAIVRSTHLILTSSRTRELIRASKPRSRRADPIIPSEAELCGRAFPTEVHDKVTVLELAVRRAADADAGTGDDSSGDCAGSNGPGAGLSGLTVEQAARALGYATTNKTSKKPGVLQARVSAFISRTAPLHQLIYARGRVRFQSRVVVEILAERHQAKRRAAASKLA